MALSKKNHTLARQILEKIGGKNLPQFDAPQWGDDEPEFPRTDGNYIVNGSHESDGGIGSICLVIKAKKLDTHQMQCFMYSDGCFTTAMLEVEKEFITIRFS